MMENRNLLIIALIAVVNALGYGIIIPILYSYSRHFGLTDFQNGLLFATFSICQFISTPIIGRMSDKYGRRPLLIGSLMGTVLSFLIMAFAPSALFLFLARALDGITAGNIPVAMAVISDTTKPEERAKGFGIIGAAFGFGFVFGPAISALTVGTWMALPFIIAAVVSLAAVIITALVLPETNKHIGEVKHGKLFDLPRLWHALFDESVGLTLLINLLYFFSFACAVIYGYQPFAIRILKLTPTVNATLFTMFGIIGLLSQVFFIQRFARYLGLKRAFSTGIFFTMIALLIMFASRSLEMFIVGSALMGVFNGFAQTLIPTILSQETDPKSQGSIMGLNASYQSIGMIVGPILGGLVATIAIPLPFLVGAAFLGVCFFLSFRILKPGVKRESAF